MTYYATDKGGKLMVVSEWIRHDSRPIDYRLYYPTGLDAECFTDILGKPLHYDGCGVYSCGRYEFPLIDNEATTTEDIEERPVKQPKWGKSYKFGEWRRF